MVFLPMPAYGLFKLLLNIDSGYTLIISTLWFLFFNQGLVSPCCHSRQEKPCMWDDFLHMARISFSCTQNWDFCFCKQSFENTNHFYLGYFRSSWNTKRKENFSFKDYYTFKNQVVAQTIRCSETFYLLLYWRAMTEEKDFHEDRSFFCFISCILLVIILCNTY